MCRAPVRQQQKHFFCRGKLRSSNHVSIKEGKYINYYTSYFFSFIPNSLKSGQFPSRNKLAFFFLFLCSWAFRGCICFISRRNCCAAIFRTFFCFLSSTFPLSFTHFDSMCALIYVRSFARFSMRFRNFCELSIEPSLIGDTRLTYTIDRIH